jgi:glycerol uptake facilitator-like aquaporin
VDAGTTWHPAEGTTRWRYMFVATAAPAAGAILSRAVDDSGNIEMRR